MPSDDVQSMLRTDFETLADRLENDQFADVVLRRLGAKRRARHGVLFFAGAAGAGLAASQFSGVVAAIAPQAASVAAGPLEPATQLVAMLVLAGALAATAFVMRQEV